MATMVILLKKEDIKCLPIGEHFVIDAGSIKINLNPEAIDELTKYLVAYKMKDVKIADYFKSEIE